MPFDVFLSHAHEDKRSVAVPLKQALEARGVKVWIDEQELKVGDSLLEAIDRGLNSSRYGVVILSPDFFRKKWTRKELAGLVAKARVNERVIPPVWHNMSIEEVRQVSPILSDTVAASTEDGIEQVATKIHQAIVDTPDTERSERVHESSREESAVLFRTRHELGRH